MGRLSTIIVSKLRLSLRHEEPKNNVLEYQHCQNWQRRRGLCKFMSSLKNIGVRDWTDGNNKNLKTKQPAERSCSYPAPTLTCSWRMPRSWPVYILLLSGESDTLSTASGSIPVTPQSTCSATLPEAATGEKQEQTNHSLSDKERA